MLKQSNIPLRSGYLNIYNRKRLVDVAGKLSVRKKMRGDAALRKLNLGSGR